MVISCYSNPLLQKSLILIIISLSTLFLMPTEAISFNFTKFTPNNSKIITLQGNAEILGNGILALTNPKNPYWNTGRVLYNTPLPIWDSATGDATSFVTSFSFVVEDYEGVASGDGLIFFLVAEEGTIIPKLSSGELLGLVDGTTAFNRFVGVEFDTSNSNNSAWWDPPYVPHVGIDVNSLISLKLMRWDKVSGGLVKVNIIYDALEKTLSVSVTNPDAQIYTVSQVIDLEKVFPQEVYVGLSATTSDQIEKHDIYSWSFSSTFSKIYHNSQAPSTLRS